MNMFKPKSAETPEGYIDQIPEPRKSEIVKLDKLIRKLTKGLDRKMYHNIIGYGKFHYKTKSGREGDWFAIGLASQKNYISVYCCLVDGDKYIAEKYKDKLPNANIGKSCIKFNKLEKIDIKELEKVIKETVKEFKKNKRKVAYSKAALVRIFRVFSLIAYHLII